MRPGKKIASRVAFTFLLLILMGGAATLLLANPSQASAAGGSKTVGQSTYITTISGSTGSSTSIANIIQNDYIVVVVGFVGTGQTVSTVTDTGSSSFTKVVSSNVNEDVEVWCGQYTAASASDTVTVKSTASASYSFRAIFAAGLTSCSGATTETNSGTSGNPSVASFTPATGSFCEEVTSEATGSSATWTDVNPFLYVSPGGAPASALTSGTNYVVDAFRGAWNSNDGATTGALTPSGSSSPKWDEVIACLPTSSAGNEIYNSAGYRGGGRTGTNVPGEGVNPVLKGDYLVQMTFVAGTAITVSSVSDSIGAGDTYTKVVSSDIHNDIEIWVGQALANSVAGGPGITSTLTASAANSEVLALNIGSISSTTAQVFTNSGTGATVTLPSFTPNPYDLCVEATNVNTGQASSTFTVPANQPLQNLGGGLVGSGTTIFGEIASRADWPSGVSSTGTVTPSVTSSPTWDVVVACFPGTVIVPLTCTVASGAATATLSLSESSGNALSPGTVACDGSSHNITVDPSRTLTSTEPADAANTRDRFSGGVTTATDATCASAASGICSAWSFTNYEQLKNTFQISANAQSTFDSGLSSVTVSGTQTGSAATLCTITVTVAASDSCASIWSDYGAVATAPSTIGGAGSNIQWLASSTTSAAITTSGGTVNFNYYKQLQNTYQASPFSPSTWDITVALSLDGSGINNCSSATSCSASLTTSDTNDVIILACGYQASTGTFNAPSDTAGLTWIQRGSTYQPNSNLRSIAMWYAVSSAPLSSDSVTCKTSASQNIQLTVFGVNGANTVSPWDSNNGLPAQAGSVGLTANPSCTMSTSNSKDFLISAYLSGSVTITNPPGFSTISTSTSGIVAGYDVVSSTQSILAVTWTQNAQRWSMLCDAIQANAVIVTGTEAGTSGQTVCETSAPTSGSSAAISCSGWADYNTAITMGPLTVSANERWSPASLHYADTTGGNTHTDNYYEQLQNTYQGTPNAQVTWDNGLTAQNAVGTLLGSAGQTVCTITLPNGGGAQSCTAYADYNQAVVIGSATIGGAPANSQWLRSGTCSFTQTSGGNTDNCNYYKQYTNTYSFSPTSPITWDASFSPIITGVQLGSAGSTICTASLVSSGGAASCSGYTDSNTAASFPASIADGSNQQWTAAGTIAFTDTTGGNTHSVSYYLDFTGISFAATPSAPAIWDGAFSVTVSGTYLGSPVTVCTITTSNGSGSASCSGTIDDGTSVTFGNAIADGSNVRWETGQATQTLSGGGTTVTAHYYNQLHNTYQATPSSPTTWDGVFTVTIIGTALGSSGQTICSVSTSNGGGSVSCSGYADYNTQVSFPASLNSGEWNEQGVYQFTDTTVGNTHVVDFASTVTQPITLTVAETGAPSVTFTLSGCSVSPTTILGDGSPHSITASLSCTITITVPSDGANTRDRFGGAATTATVLTCASGTCSGFSATYYYLVQNTYEATPNAQVTWDAGLTAQNVLGTLLGSSGQTLCAITLTSGGGAQSCAAYADYNAAAVIGSATIGGAPANSQWLRSGACSFAQTSGGNTDNCNYYKQYTNNFAYSVTDGGTPTAPTLTCTQLGSSTGCGTLGISVTAIWVDSGGSYSATNPTAGSTGSERWDSNSASGTLSSGGSSITIAYYHQYLLTFSYSVIDGGSPTAPVASGSQFGSAYAPSLTGSAVGYWFDASGSVTFTNPVAGGSNERWDSPVSSVLATSSSTTALTYYHQYQNTYRFSPAAPTSWDNGFSSAVTGTQLGVGSTTICTASLISGGGAASCSGYTDSGTAAALPSSIADGSNRHWTASGTTSFTDSTGGNTHSVSYYEQFSGLTFTANPGAPSTWDSALSIAVTGTSLGSSGTLCTIVTSGGGGAASCSSLIDAGTSITLANAIADGANVRWETGQAVQSPGAGSTSTANYYEQLQNTYQVTPLAQGTWDAGLTFTITGTYLGTGGSTIATISPSGGSGVTGTTAWADYNTQVSFPSNPSGQGANIRWQASGTSSFTQSTGGNTNDVDYYKQYSNTFQYAVLDGGSPASPSLTCTQLGSSVACGTLTTSPVAIWVDAGGSYSSTNPTSGSTGSERWDSAAASGTSSSGGAAITIDYYHQFLQTLSYSILGGGSPAPPTAAGSQFGSAYAPSLTGAATGYWFDAVGSVTFTNPLVGAPSQKWQSAVSSVPATSSGATSLTYYHQYFNTYDFSPTSPTTWDSNYSPTVTGTQIGVGSVTICTASLLSGAGAASCGGYTDAGTLATFPASIADGIHGQWTGAAPTSFTDSSGGNTHMVSYYEQYSALTFTASPTAPSTWDSALSISVSGTSLGAGVTVCTITTAGGAGAASCSGLIDAGTSVTFANAITDGANARWETGHATQTPTTGSTTTANYYLQLKDTYQATPNAQLTWDAGLTSPTVTGTVLGTGSTAVCALTLTSGGGAASCAGWADYNLPVSLGGIGGAPANSRWQARGTTSFTDNGAGGNTYNVNYYKQYTLTVVGGNGIGYSVASQTGDSYWDSGTSLTVSSNGVYDRVAGAGQRVASWKVDGGSATSVSTTGTAVTSSIAMTAAHTVTFNSVAQFQVTLDAGAAAALAGITPPTVSGDDYWYDSGTSVSLTLNGVWGRTATTGNRLSSYAINGGAPTNTATTGLAVVLSALPIASPQSIVTTTTVQYFLTVSGGNGIAYSVGPPIAGDIGWYDSGTSLTVSSNGVYARVAGTGERVASWNLDGGASNAVATAGTVTTSPITMSAAHAVTFASVAQYQLNLDAGATSALSSITPPTIPGDNYWYDSGSSVTYDGNGVFARGSGTGARSTGWSIDGGSSTAVLTVATFPITLTNIVAPHTVHVSTVAQYQLTLDAGATSALNSVTPPTVPSDNYWYDSGSSVTVTLNGVFGRGGGTGTRLTGFAINGGADNPVSTTGAVTALNGAGIISPGSISVTTVTQYLLTLTVSPPVAGTVIYVTPPSVAGDTGWYDSATVVAFSVVSNSGYNFARWVGTGACSFTGTLQASSVTMTCAASESASFAGFVLQSITLRAASSVGLTPYFAITGCGAAPDIIFADGSPHLIQLNPSCSFRISVDNTGGTRYGFSVSGVFSDTSPAEVSCATGTCTPVVLGFFEQADGQFAYSVSDSGTGYSAPTLTCTQLGLPGQCGTLTKSPASYWLDFGTSWAATNPLMGSNGTARWEAATASGTMSAPASFTLVYSHQFLVSLAAEPQAAGTTSPPSGTSQWVDSGSDLSLTASGSAGYNFSSWTTSNPNEVTLSNYKAASTTASIGGSAVITAHFSVAIIPITFSESGLPAGITWSVTLSGNTATSITTSLTFDLPPGTYPWNALSPLSSTTSAVRFIASVSSGTITAEGPSAYSIAFTTQYYLTVGVGSSASGITLTPASGWYDAGDSFALNATAAPSAFLYFVSWNGIGSGSYTGPAPVAQVSINGPISETANFAHEMGTVTFSESGLPAGAVWSVLLNGVNQTTRGDSITFSGVAVGSIVDWVLQSSVSPAETGSLQVLSTANTTITITFTTSPSTVTSTSTFTTVSVSTSTSKGTTVTVTVNSSSSTTVTSTSTTQGVSGSIDLDYALIALVALLLFLLVVAVARRRSKVEN